MATKTTRETGAMVIKRAFPDNMTLWEARIEGGDSRRPEKLEAIHLGGTVVIVHEYGNGEWDAYVPAARSNRVDAALLAIGECAGYDPYMTLSDHAIPMDKLPPGTPDPRD